jgi:uncharacterized protein YkwD
MFRFARCVALVAACGMISAAVAQEKKDAKDAKDTKDTKKKDEFKVSAEEQGVIDLTNAERKGAEKPLPPLKMNPKLMEAARKHAANMAAQEKMDHVLDGKNPADRATAAGYKWRAVGENVAAGQKTPKEVVKAWMDSPPHRENILNDAYNEIGVAVAKGKDGMLYWAQVFGKQ